MTKDVQAIVLSKLAHHSALQADFDELDLSSELRCLKLDSLAVLEIVFELEEHFHTLFDSDEVRRLISIADLINLVNRSRIKAA